MSRRLPHFNRESLETALLAAGVRYVWMKELGGHRKKIRDDSPNIALRNASFRNYADHMLTLSGELVVPEPSSLALFGIGLLVLALIVRYRKRRVV